MDAFGGLLDGPRARGAFALRTIMSPPWSLRILAESPLTVLAIVTGHAWVVPERGDPVRLGIGDVAVTRGPDHYSVTDDPANPTDVVIHPGQRCCSPEGESMEWRLALAADLLCEPDATVGSVAEKVGYSSPFALSSAFKRVRGVSQQEHRARAMSPT